MPTAQIKINGRIAEFNVPEGTTEAQVIAYVRNNPHKFNAPTPKIVEKEYDWTTPISKLHSAASGSFGDELQGLGGAITEKGWELFGGNKSNVNLDELRQRGYVAGDPRQSFGETYREGRNLARQQEEAFSNENPKSGLALDIGGGLLTGGAGLAKSGVKSLLDVAKSGVKTGSGIGAIYGLGSSEADLTKGDIGQALQDTAKGAAVGTVTGIAPAAATKMFRETASVITSPKTSKMYHDAVDLLEKSGVKLTTGQKSGSTRLKSLEGTMGNTLLGGSIKNTMESQQMQLQSKLMKLSGFTANDITEGLVTKPAIDKTAKRFSNRYTKILEGKTVDLNTDSFHKTLDDVIRENGMLVGKLKKREIPSIVEEFKGMISKPLTGEEYQKIRSQLGTLERRSESHMSALYADIKNALDDHFYKGVTKNVQKGKSIIDKEYANYIRLRDTFKNNATASTGVLPLASLRNSAFKKPASTEFTKLLDAASAVIPDRFSNSGTPSRLMDIATFGAGFHDLATGGILAGSSLLGSKALSSGLLGNIGRDLSEDQLMKLGLLGSFSGKGGLSGSIPNIIVNE